MAAHKPTATDITREHYMRKDVKEIICKYAMPGTDGRWRAANGDFWKWYHPDPSGRTRLLNVVKDYDYIANNHRTFYLTLNVFDPESFMVDRPQDEVTSDNPLGGPADTVEYSLSVDIDAGKGHDIETPDVKRAVERAAQFFVKYLASNGISNSVAALFSGGGIYITINSGICVPKTAKGRAAFFVAVTDAFNRLIEHVSDEFFKEDPECEGKVKFDALNNAKRVFKCILSIHKRKPFAVTPLDTDMIRIDFDRARLPIKEDMIEECQEWGKTCDHDERVTLFTLLDEFRTPDNDRKKETSEFGEIWVSSFGVDTAYFPPCIAHIINVPNRGEGKTRFTALLSSFLYQMGWDEESAWKLVKAVSDRNGVVDAEHIFESSYGRMKCTSCHKIQEDGAGYPHRGLKGLGACQPTPECGRWPGDYAFAYAFWDAQEKRKKRAMTAEGPTVIDAYRAMLRNEELLRNEQEFDMWEWRKNKHKIQKAVKKNRMSATDEEKAHKDLKKFKDVFEKIGMSYEDLCPIPSEAKDNKEEFSWRIRNRAFNVLRTGDPIKYIADSCNRTVLGADTAFRKIACCISAQNVNQTNGLHIKFSGDSSGGKTITVYTFAHHLPFEMVLKGSMSSKAGFYHKDGARVLRVLDDYQEGNEDLDTVIKQTSSEFHRIYEHRTVINHVGRVLTIASEQTWAITSVFGSSDIQVLNRILPINVNDSVALTKDVNKKTVERYGKGELQQPVDDTVLVCRAMFQILRDAPFINVRVPFYDRIRWIDTSNRRNPSLFMDLLISVTALNRFQREQDSDGYYLATEVDFNTAKALFNDNEAEELVRRFTARERDVINLLTSNADGLTRDKIAEKMKIAPQRVSQILSGEKGKGGLMQKVQIAETKRSDMKTLSEDLRRTTHMTIYSLKEYDKFAGFDAVVKLNPDDGEASRRKDERDDERNDERKLTDSGKGHERKKRKKEKEREKRRE